MYNNQHLIYYKMEFKVTKGKWEASSIELKDYENHIIVSGNEIICHLYNNGNQKANAKLIASAPDLLEALTMLIKETEDYVNETACGNTYLDIAREKARKAIEKALL